jgi:hypothetical protein
LDKAILAKRVAVYEKAKQLNPLRWSGQTRNWAPITEVCLNPKKHNSETDEELSLDPPSPTISVMSEAAKQFSDIDWVGYAQ